MLGFLQDFGMCLWELVPTLKDEKAPIAFETPVHPKVVFRMKNEDGALCKPLRFLHTKLHLCGPRFVHKALSCCN